MVIVIVAVIVAVVGVADCRVAAICIADVACETRLQWLCFNMFR